MSWLTTVRSALGLAPRERARLPSSLTGKVMQDQSLWQQFQRIGGNLTPAQVSNIIRQADAGDMTRLVDLANDSRQKDSHLQAVLAQSEESIAGLEWRLSLPKEALARETRAMRFVEEHLRGEEACAALTGLIAHLAGAVYYGYAVGEIEWTKDAKRRLVPGNFTCQSPRRFGFRQSDGTFIWRDMGMPWEGVDFRAEFPNRFVVSQPRITGDVPCREGLARVLMWAALFRNWAIVDWLRTGEIAWKPWRIGTFKKGANPEDVDSLYTILERLSSTGAAAIPETTTIDVKWPSGGTSRPTHAELFNVVAQEMSKAVLGQTETVQASDTSGYAQAKVHQAVRANLLSARARHIAAVLTRDLIRPMVEMNFGAHLRVPAFQFVTQDPVDLDKFATAVATLASKARLRIPSAWVRETAGIPHPEEDEECIGGTPASPAAPADGEPDAQDPSEDPNAADNTPADDIAPSEDAQDAVDNPPPEKRPP